MRDIEVVIKEELFDELKVKVGQLTCVIDKDNDLRVCGSLTAGEMHFDEYLLYVKANLCDEKNNAWFVLREYSGVDFEMVKYDSFSIDCANIGRFMDLGKFHHVELFPTLVKKKESDNDISF